MSAERESTPRDHQSDPARTPGDGWVGEGGASHLGPATHIGSGHPEHESDADDGEHDGDDENGDEADGDSDAR